MLLIIELAMLAGGIWAIFTGKIPSSLVGGKKHQVKGTMARVLGLLFILPLPVAFLGAVVLIALFGDAGQRYAIVLEIITVIGVALLAFVLVRIVGKPADQTSIPKQ